MVVYIEIDVTCSIDNETIMHWFQNKKTRRSWELKLTITILKVLVWCYAVKGSADWANKKKGEKKQWCIPFSRIHEISNEVYSNTTCGWWDSIDYRKLDSHIKKSIVLLLYIKLNELFDIYKVSSTCQGPHTQFTFILKTRSH